MDITVSPSKTGGEVFAPPSKSVFHRLIICAALCEGTSEIKPLPSSDDINATLGAVKSLGADIEYTDSSVIIKGIGNFEASSDAFKINCGESGSTLRFLIPVAAALGKKASFNGSGRLPNRPMDAYVPVLKEHGIDVKYDGVLPFSVSGKLSAGEFRIPADISSQFITGLLFALPLLEGDSEIVFTTPLQSAPYIDITVSVLNSFGITVTPTESGFFVKGNQRYTPCNIVCEGDWSNAAFLLCAGAANGNVTCKGLNLNSKQGDKKIVDILRRFGATCVERENEVIVHSDSLLHGIEIDASDIPDLIPVLCAVAACAECKTYIYNASRLRIKESDRIAAVEDVLNRLGVKTESTFDTLTVYPSPVHGGEINSFNDHRIAMTAAVLALKADSEVTIHGAECVNKSFPDFFTRYGEIGGRFSACSH